jgi:SAM-dependent methyltransferase
MVAADIPFAERRFRTAAKHYLEGRPAYASLLIRRVVELTGVTRDHRVLDLGCGPGQLALAFAPFAREVTAIDPEPEMLLIAAARAAQAGADIRFLAGSSETLAPSLGRFRLTVIGRAFHWMDRPRCLERLDDMTEPEGAVALFGDRHPKLPENGWRETFKGLIGRYAADDDTRVDRDAPGWLPHEAVLLDSPFSRLERIAVIERRHTPVERFIDRAFSMSSSSEARLGPRAAELAGELRAAMASFAPEGLVTEVVESQALIARRPTTPSPSFG